MLLQYFVILGRNDTPLYELDINYTTPIPPKKSPTQLKQFLLHASLDTLDQIQYAQPQCFIKANPIEKYHESHIYAYVTYGYARMLALCSDTLDTSRTEQMMFGTSMQESGTSTTVSGSGASTAYSGGGTPSKSPSQSDRRRFEDALKAFFNEVHASYVGIVMNPFYEMDTPIGVAHFDQHVRNLYQKYLR